MSLALALPSQDRRPLPALTPMRAQNVAQGGQIYWLAVGAASALAANSGDLFANAFGFLHGLPLLGAAFAATLWLENRATRPTQAFYWAAILLVGIAATNLADFTEQNFGPAAFAALAVLLGATFLKRDTTVRPSDDFPAVGALYWLRMAIAGTLGAALGDFSSLMSGVGPTMASMILFGGVAALIAARRLGLLGANLSFWAIVVAIGAAGTSLGDLSAHGVGLVSSAAFAAIVMLAIVFFKAPKPLPDYAARAALA